MYFFLSIYNMSTIITILYTLQENLLNNFSGPISLSKFLTTLLTYYESVDFLSVLELALSLIKEGKSVLSTNIFFSYLNDMSFTLDKYINSELLLDFLRVTDSYQVLKSKGLFSPVLSEHFWKSLCFYEADYGGKLFLLFINETPLSIDQLKFILEGVNSTSANQNYNLVRVKACYFLDPYKTSKAYMDISKNVNVSLPCFVYIQEQMRKKL